MNKATPPTYLAKAGGLYSDGRTVSVLLALTGLLANPTGGSVARNANESAGRELRQAVMTGKAPTLEAYGRLLLASKLIEVRLRRKSTFWPVAAATPYS